MPNPLCHHLAAHGSRGPDTVETAANRAADFASTADRSELMNVHEAAHLLNVTASWIYEHSRPDCQDALPAIKLGKYLRFDRGDLLAYIAQKREVARVRRRTR